MKKAIHCFTHAGKELELHCETCGELICWKCIARGGEHHDHEYEELTQAFEMYKAVVVSLLEPIKKKAATITKALGHIDERCGAISDQRAATAEEIHANFRCLREALDVRETELIGQLDKETQGKLKRLAAQKDQVEITLAQLNSYIHFMRESLETGDKGNVAHYRKVLKANTELQERQVDILSMKPNSEADIAFSVSTDLIKMCRNYGSIFQPGQHSLAPTRYCITGTGVEVAMVGEPCTAILKAYQGSMCKSLTCTVFSEICETSSPATNVVKSGPSACEIVYQPIVKGRHHLHIRAGGQHIDGSPFLVKVTSPIEDLGGQIMMIGQLRVPWGITVDYARGELLVSEWSGHCVSVFSPSGKKIAQVSRVIPVR